MIEIKFDGAELRNPVPLMPKEHKHKFELRFECRTDDYEDILEIISRAGKSTAHPLLSGKTKIQTTGTVGDLEISGYDASIDGTYEKCVIIGDVDVEEIPGTGGTWWKYTFTIQQAERADARPAWYTTALQGQAPITDPITDVIETILTLENS